MVVKNNILLVSISAPPKNAPESIQVGRYLRHLVDEYHVTLVTTPVDDGWRRHDSSLVPDYNVAQTILVDFCFRKYILKVLRRINSRLMQMPDGDFWFSYMYRQIVNKLEKRPSLIYSRSTPYSSAVLAYKLKEIYRVPWVLHLSDPWGDNPFHKYGKNIYKYQQQIEEVCFKSADKIALTTDKLIDYYSEKYPEYTDKLFLSNNVYDDAAIINNTAIQLNAPLTFVCTGSFYGNRTPLPLLIALDHLKERNPKILNKIQFMFAGNIDDKNKESIAFYAFNNVSFVGNVSYAEAVKMQDTAHVLISIDADQPGEIYKVFLPSKIMDYMSRRRRILALTPKGSMTERLLNEGYGTSFTYSETEAIAHHIEHLVEEFEKTNYQYFETPTPLYEYGAKYNVNRLITLFDSLIN